MKNGLLAISLLSRSNKFFVLTMRLLLIGLAIFCAVGCSTSESINLTLPTECTAAYSPSIGENLCNERDRATNSYARVETEPSHKEQRIYLLHTMLTVFVVARVQLGRMQPRVPAGRHRDSSVYDVSFDADKRIESVLYIIPVGADSQRIRVPGADGLMLPATLYRPRGCGTSREPAIVLLHG